MLLVDQDKDEQKWGDILAPKLSAMVRGDSFRVDSLDLLVYREAPLRAFMSREFPYLRVSRNKFRASLNERCLAELCVDIIRISFPK